jgi:predicted glutamine amidotransferase
MAHGGRRAPSSGMCRLLGWAGRRPTTLADLLGEEDLAAFTGMSALHGDGWGVARSTARGVQVRKRPDAARTSPRFDRWARSRRSDLGLAHLRRATLGLSVGTANTHPFTDRRIAFAHNGSISPPVALDRLLIPRTADRRRGTTDSERYFLAVAERMDAGATPEEALRTTADAIAATATFTSLNCLLLTPEALYAFCRINPSGPMEDDDPEYYTLRYRVADGAVVVASSGWGAGWRDLADGDLLVVERHSLELSVQSTVGLSSAP